MSLANLASPIFDHALRTPDHPAVRGPMGENRVTLSYAELRDAVAEAAETLRGRGLTVGDRMVLIAPTTPEFIVWFFAAQSLGVVVVAVNPLSTPRELGFVLTDSGASLVVAHPACAEAGTVAAEEAGVPLTRLPVISPGQSFPPAPDAAPLPRDPQDVAVLLYTSGTTGTPKGAMLTVNNLAIVGEVAQQIADTRPEERFGTALPLFHIFGLSSVTMVALHTGATLTLFPRFDPQELLDTIAGDRLKVVAGVPTMWNALVHGTTGDVDTSSLRLAISGGASMAVETMRAFEKRFDAKIAEGYGLTESTASGSFNPWNGLIVPGSVGIPVPGMDIKVVTPEGQVAGTDEIGEVHLRGPLIMKGYWNRPEATAAAFDEEGYFRTGDLGRVDERGYLHIVDRVKDLIIHGGYNVYPREVEEVLYEHPAVLEAAVVGSADSHYGQQVAAVITPMPGQELSAEEVEEWCRKHLSAYKFPRIVKIVPALPKGPTGKILKRSIDLDAL